MPGRRRHRQQEFLKFLRTLDREFPPELDLHLILDDYQTHKHAGVAARLAQHPRFHLRFIPTSSSWLKLVERWFRELTEKALRRGVFHIVPDLIAAIGDFLDARSDDPKAFVWTASIDAILEKVGRCKAVLTTLHQEATSAASSPDSGEMDAGNGAPPTGRTATSRGSPHGGTRAYPEFPPQLTPRSCAGVTTRAAASSTLVSGKQTSRNRRDHDHHRICAAARRADLGHRPRLQAGLASVREGHRPADHRDPDRRGAQPSDLGILAGPLAAGLYGMVVKRVRDGQQPEAGDVFGQMNRCWSFFAAALVLGILIGLASLTIIGGILLATIWLYVVPLMVDRGMGLGEAMRASYEMVKQAGFWEHLALVIAFVVIASLANGALAILATPFLIAAVAAGYYVAAGKGDELERAAV